ncbi:MAG: hypothetical protein RL660_1988 [Bacteroidota bacterium]|jgi:L-ascorbate metabolism protein UlaG (beta-lactamase superfamily)
MPKQTLPTHNPQLQFISGISTAHPLSSAGLYTNLDGDSFRPFSDVLKWQSSSKPLKQFKKNQVSGIEVVANDNFISSAQDGVTWLGHCTFLFRLNGSLIITDPVLGKVSNVMPRHTALPCKPEALVGIDCILISHNHRDHLDKKSLKLLCAQNPDAIIYTGLQIGKLLRRWKITNTIVEAGWWQQYPTINGISITYLPAKHWSRRALADTNDMLWGSFTLQTTTHTLYFGADSGYGIHFSEIQKHFPSIDYAFIGIGAYMPEWFMEASHTGPTTAIQAVHDLKAKHFIPMHYGTFDLSDEPIFWPAQELKKLQSTCNATVNFLNIGTKKYF